MGRLVRELSVHELAHQQIVVRLKAQLEAAEDEKEKRGVEHNGKQQSGCAIQFFAFV